MDREYPESRAELEDKELWSYADLQKLGAETGYGTIVGVQRPELIEHAVDALSLPETAETADREERPTTADSVENQGTEADAMKSDGGRTVEQQKEEDREPPESDALEVGHEGSEKLSPEGAPDNSGATVEPPEGVPDDLSPDDLEPGAAPAPRGQTADDSENQSESSETADTPDEDDDSDSGGLLDRIRGDNESETRSPEEIVEDADDPEERDRREEVLGQLDDAMAAEDDVDQEESTDADPSGDPSPAPTPSTSKSNGMIVDESVVGHLIDLPFNGAAAATGWEGWELTPQERQANAELFVAAADEHDIDVGPTAMLALSVAGTFGGRAMRYRRQSSSDDVQEDRGGPDRDEGRADQGGADLEEPQGASDDVVQEEIPETPSRTATDSENQSETAGDGGFDFHDSSSY